MLLISCLRILGQSLQNGEILRILLKRKLHKSLKREKNILEKKINELIVKIKEKGTKKKEKKRKYLKLPL